MKFFLIKWPTDFYEQPSYLQGDIFLMYVRLNLKTIKFYLMKLATDFYEQPSY